MSFRLVFFLTTAVILTSCAPTDRLVISGLDMDAILEAGGGIPVVAGSAQTGADRGVISVVSPQACTFVDAQVITEHADVNVCILGVSGSTDVLNCFEVFQKAAACERRSSEPL